MAVTMEQVLAYVDQDEPRYSEAARLGSGAIPHLLLLMEQGDPSRAPKVIYLAAFIGTDQAIGVLDRAVQSPDPYLRTAAAGALRYLTEVPPVLAVKLLKDQDVGVRLQALDSVAIKHPTGVEATLQELAEHDPEVGLRQRASEILKDLP